MRLGGLGSAFVAALVLAAPAGAQQQQEVVMRERFDGGTDAWERVRLDRRQTEYATTSTGGEQVLVATSQNSAAAYLRRIETAVPERAVLQWRWRVSASLIENERERERRGDDYAARVFVIFGDEPFERGTRALSYVWAGQEPVGARFRNPVVDDVATVVVRSGDGAAGRWVREQRNLVADYQDAFGEDPPAITGIAVMVDTDDTGSRAISWFDDVVLEIAPADDGPVGADRF